MLYFTIFDKLTKNSDNKEYTGLIIINRLSKSAMLKQICFPRADTTAFCLRNFTYKFGVPNQFICDQSKCLSRYQFRSLYSGFNIDLRFNAHKAS